MTCTLCESWNHSPVNPKTLHPNRQLTVTSHNVEVALLVGYAWGQIDAWKKVDGERSQLCADHQEMVASMIQRLTQ